MSEQDLENRTRGYLLRTLSEDEQERMERRFFADDDSFDHLLAEEDELIDDYAAGRLSGADRTLFEKAFLASPGRRRRVAFAQAAHAALAPGARLARPSRARGTWSAWLPAAAAAVFAIASAGLAWRNVLLERRLAALTAEQAADRERQRHLAAQLEAERARAGVPPDPAGTRDASGQPVDRPLPRVASFLLAAGSVRDLSAGDVLQVPAGTETVRLLAPVEAHWRHVSYHALLRTVEGREVWVATGLLPEAAPGVRSIPIGVPAARLPAGDYILTLAGVSPPQPPAEIADHYFRVARR